jgi:hypothetical protein
LSKTELILWGFFMNRYFRFLFLSLTFAFFLQPQQVLSDDIPVVPDCRDKQAVVRSGNTGARCYPSLGDACDTDILQKKCADKSQASGSSAGHFDLKCSNEQQLSCDKSVVIKAFTSAVVENSSYNPKPIEYSCKWSLVACCVCVPKTKAGPKELPQPTIAADY